MSMGIVAFHGACIVHLHCYRTCGRRVAYEATAGPSALGWCSNIPVRLHQASLMGQPRTLCCFYVLEHMFFHSPLLAVCGSGAGKNEITFAQVHIFSYVIRYVHYLPWIKSILGIRF